MKDVCVFDIETDGLEDFTVIHCITFNYFDGDKWTMFTTSNYDQMKAIFERDYLFIGHWITFYDIPVIEELLKIRFTDNILDTEFISEYLFDKEEKHGLEKWGEKVGIAKVEVGEDEWKILTESEWKRFDRDPYIREKYQRVVQEVMVPRCEEDVKINTDIFLRFMEHLTEIYGGDHTHFRKYFTFLLSNISLQIKNRWKLDVEALENNLGELMDIFVTSKNSLEESMLRVEKTRPMSKPNKMYKKDGKFTAVAKRWLKHLEEQDLPVTHKEDIKIHQKWEEPNARSPEQIKDWLFGMKWKPDYFKFPKRKKGPVKAVPQVKKGGELSESVKLLIKKNPKVQLLENYSIVKSRKECLEGFTKNMDEDGFIKAEIGGITSTLRVRHNTVVNLPGMDKMYGEHIRGVLVSKPGHILCGSDLDSLEDRCKQHWIKPFDPQYVESMSDPFYDPHLDLAMVAKDISEEEVNFFKYMKAKGKFPLERLDEFFLKMGVEKQKELYGKIGELRTGYKTTNYSATYGVRAKTLSRESGKSMRESQRMLDTFHKRNWAIDEVAKKAITKVVKGQMWVYNEINKFWYPLRAEKDIFSALNQGLGAYVFNMWIYFQRMKGLKEYVGQFHDEVALDVLDTDKDKERTKKILLDSIEDVNKSLSLRVRMSCDVQFGYKYSEIH